MPERVIVMNRLRKVLRAALGLQKSSILDIAGTGGDPLAQF
jgi:hypothetical protein